MCTLYSTHCTVYTVQLILPDIYPDMPRILTYYWKVQVGRKLDGSPYNEIQRNPEIILKLLFFDKTLVKQAFSLSCNSLEREILFYTD